MATGAKRGKIYLIRHGQTTGNGRHYVGWEDLPLNDVGKDQACKIADILKDRPIASIHTSALARAITTAEPLSCDKKIKIHTDKRLNEIHYGAFQGRLKSDLDLKLRKDYRYQNLPEGESLHDVYLRVAQYWDELSQQLTTSQNIAIVSHYWSIRILFGILQKKSFDDLFLPKGYKPANGSIYEVDMQLDELGDPICMSHGYLEESDAAPIYALKERSV